MREYVSEVSDPEVDAGIALPAITFTLDGEKFSCVTGMNGDTLLEWSELGLAAAEDVPVTSPEGASLIARFLRVAFGPEEYLRFRRHIRAHNTSPSVVLKVVSGIQEELTAAVQEATGRPTQAPSPSSPGDADPAAQRARLVSLARGEVTWADAPPPRPEPQDHPGKGGASRKRAASRG